MVYTNGIMKMTTLDFLAFSLPGIDLFIQAVDRSVQSTGETFEKCAKDGQKQIHDYLAARDAFREQPTHAPIPSPTTLTLRELMESRFCRSPLAAARNVVYIVRDGESVLYVGSSRYNARKRMKAHEKARSPLGKALRTDPNAKTWNVEMIFHADYKLAARKERELIAQLMPSFCRRSF